jgi:hypothetical protein
MDSFNEARGEEDSAAVVAEMHAPDPALLRDLGIDVAAAERLGALAPGPADDGMLPPS